MQYIKLRTLVAPGELLFRRFGDEIGSVVVPASVSNTEAKFKHSHKVENSYNMMAGKAGHNVITRKIKSLSKRNVK